MIAESDLVIDENCFLPLSFEVTSNSPCSFSVYVDVIESKNKSVRQLSC